MINVYSTLNAAGTIFSCNEKQCLYQQTLETEKEKKENALLSINSDIPVLSFSYFLSFCLQ